MCWQALDACRAARTLLVSREERIDELEARLARAHRDLLLTEGKRVGWLDAQA